MNKKKISKIKKTHINKTKIIKKKKLKKKNKLIFPLKKPKYKSLIIILTINIRNNKNTS